MNVEAGVSQGSFAERLMFIAQPKSIDMDWGYERSVTDPMTVLRDGTLGVSGDVYEINEGVVVIFPMPHMGL